LAGAGLFAQTAGQETLYRPGSGVVLPKVIKQVQPRYTPEALRARIQGDVDIEAVVRSDGTVGDARVVRSLDTQFGLDAAAVTAAKQWTFEPGTLKGAPVNVLVAINLTFRMAPRAEDLARQQQMAIGGLPLTLSPEEFVGGAVSASAAGVTAPKIITATEA